MSAARSAAQKAHAAAEQAERSERAEQEIVSRTKVLRARKVEHRLVLKARHEKAQAEEPCALFLPEEPPCPDCGARQDKGEAHASWCRRGPEAPIGEAPQARSVRRDLYPVRGDR